MHLSRPRSSILRSRKDIEALLESGDTLFRYPVKIYFLKKEDAAAPRMMVSVPKKNFHQAVDRNLLKRRIRESFRLNRDALEGVAADILFVYLGKEIEDYDIISKRIREGLRAVAQKCGALTRDSE